MSIYSAYSCNQKENGSILVYDLDPRTIPKYYVTVRTVLKSAQFWTPVCLVLLRTRIIRPFFNAPYVLETAHAKC